MKGPYETKKWKKSKKIFYCRTMFYILPKGD